MSVNTPPALSPLPFGGESDSPATPLLVQLLKLCSLINEPMKEGVCDPAGASTNEVKVVMALAGEGPMAGHDLVHILGTTPMNVSRAIAGLKARNWVEDFTDPDNRRRRPVRLTGDGEVAYRQMQPLLDTVAGALLNKLTVRQHRELSHLTGLVLGRIADWEKARSAITSDD